MKSKRFFIVVEAVATGLLQLGVILIGAAVIQFSFSEPVTPEHFRAILGVAYLGVFLFFLGASFKKCL